MPSTEERLTAVETEQKNIFHQLTELKNDVKDIHRLTTAVETLATKMDGVSGKIDSMDGRLDAMEKAPASKFERYKEAIITGIITLLLGAIGGSLFALIFK